MDLETQSERLWSTPRASPNENRTTRHQPSVEAGKHGRNLAGDAMQWPTPVANDTQRSPEAYKTMRAGIGRSSVSSLKIASEAWPTLGDGKSSGSADYPATATHVVGVTLTDAAVRGHRGRPHPTTPPAGSDTSPSTPTAPRPSLALNPAFVEALMNCPRGWTKMCSCPGACLCHRIDRLRALGNGVVVEQGAVAFAMLARRLAGGE